MASDKYIVELSNWFNANRQSLSAIDQLDKIYKVIAANKDKKDKLQSAIINIERLQRDASNKIKTLPKLSKKPKYGEKEKHDKALDVANNYIYSLDVFKKFVKLQIGELVSQEKTGNKAEEARLKNIKALDKQRGLLSFIYQTNKEPDVENIIKKISVYIDAGDISDEDLQLITKEISSLDKKYNTVSKLTDKLNALIGKASALDIDNAIKDDFIARIKEAAKAPDSINVSELEATYRQLSKAPKMQVVTLENFKKLPVIDQIRGIVSKDVDKSIIASVSLSGLIEQLGLPSWANELIYSRAKEDKSGAVDTINDINRMNKINNYINSKEDITDDIKALIGKEAFYNSSAATIENIIDKRVSQLNAIGENKFTSAIKKQIDIDESLSIARQKLEKATSRYERSVARKNIIDIQKQQKENQDVAISGAEEWKSASEEYKNIKNKYDTAVAELEKLKANEPSFKQATAHTAWVRDVQRKQAEIAGLNTQVLSQASIVKRAKKEYEDKYKSDRQFINEQDKKTAEDNQGILISFLSKIEADKSLAESDKKSIIEEASKLDKEINNQEYSKELESIKLKFEGIESGVIAQESYINALKEKINSSPLSEQQKSSYINLINSIPKDLPPQEFQKEISKFAGIADVSSNNTAQDTKIQDLQKQMATIAGNNINVLDAIKAFESKYGKMPVDTTEDKLPQGLTIEEFNQYVKNINAFNNVEKQLGALKNEIDQLKSVA